ncbi:MAG: hypothetical protein AB7H77_07030 [Bdellovibrionales bacterium]
MHPAKETLGIISLLVAFVSYIPYARMTIRQAIKPHMFSWIIWGTMNAITFLAQNSRSAGPGAWATGFSAAGCFFIAVLAFRHGEKNITLGDWIAFLASLSTLPIWYATKDPLWAVLLITAINVAAFYPTLRKSWINPHEEMISQFLLSDIKHVASLLALQNYSIVTALYPAMGLVLNTGFAATVLGRRNHRKKTT